MMYEVYKIYKMYKKGLRKYKTNKRYLSQYGFYNGAKSQQVAGDLPSQYKKRWGACIW